MVLVVFIVITLLIGWFGPQWLVPRLPGSMPVLVASVATLALGAGTVWAGAQLFGAAGVEEAQSAFDRGFNAWKIMLLLAPASALHAARNLAKEDT
ncbi:MAG: hypothetical protein AAF409_12270 [Pseudomonadota bacterium]